MSMIGPELPVDFATLNDDQRSRSSWTRRLRSFRPRPLHASAIVSCVVAYKAFAMSYDSLHHLATRNLVAPGLASNVPIAIDGLMVGSVIATASFRKRGAGWWYATGLFVLSTLVSVLGNVEYAHEIGGDIVAVILHAGMPVTMMFAVHLTLMLWNDRKYGANAPALGAADRIDVDTVEFVSEPAQFVSEPAQEEKTAPLHDVIATPVRGLRHVTLPLDPHRADALLGGKHTLVHAGERS
ncbi:DUF2637 domain-containing protein [Nocardia sp. GP40]|uniref:DUF2637 domain-containing protein n=1 Tax=Nocardia sp. GP40 TaxID=3156268 RepID=UPI003D1CEFA6